MSSPRRIIFSGKVRSGMMKAPIMMYEGGRITPINLKKMAGIIIPIKKGIVHKRITHKNEQKKSCKKMEAIAHKSIPHGASLNIRQSILRAFK